MDLDRLPPRSVAPSGATIPEHLREPALDDAERARLIGVLDGLPAELLARVEAAAVELGVPNLKSHRATRAHGALVPADQGDKGASEPMSVIVPDDPSSLEVAEVQDHIADIMFTSTFEPDENCLLCKRGVALGVWAHYGYPEGPWADEGGEGSGNDES